MAYASSGLAVAPGGLDQGRGGFERRPPPGLLSGGERPRPEGFGGRERGRGALAAFELLKNLIVIASIIVVVSLLGRVIRGLRSQRR